MAEQRPFADLAWTGKGKVTRREKFLAEMDAVIPWETFLQRIEPYYPKPGNGRPPLELKAHEQIQRQRRSALGIGLPNPLFEHARLHRFMREVFETVAYAKTTDAEAARRLVDEGNALLKRIK